MLRSTFACMFLLKSNTQESYTWYQQAAAPHLEAKQV
jgi:hypothetical protein